MLCIIPCTTYGEDSWRGRRMGETIGFHFKRRYIHVLATMYLDNNFQDGKPNFIDVLHPGNVSGSLVYDSPMPLHPDEQQKKVDRSIIEILYGNAFEVDNDNSGIINQVRGLSAWDAWYSLDPPEPVNWPGDPRNTQRPKLLRIIPKEATTGFVPFTVWRIGPFLKRGAVIFSIAIKVQGESFTELVARDRVCTIDGPMRLFSRIQYSYIRRMPVSKRKSWLQQLEHYRKYLNCGESYDIVLLGKRFADGVRVVQKSFMSKSVLQLPELKTGVRYTALKPSFTMSVRTPYTVVKNIASLKKMSATLKENRHAIHQVDA